MVFSPKGASEGTLQKLAVEVAVAPGEGIFVTSGWSREARLSQPVAPRLKMVKKPAGSPDSQTEERVMSIARFSIEKPLITWLIILGSLLGGLWGFTSLGRLEDPAFTIKQVVIATEYPGATAEQVAIEVTEPLESALQKMGEVDKITSMNQPGQSLITVEVFSTFGGDELPPIWTKLRNRVSDAARFLPAGVSEPYVNDSFGDVFGIYYAVTAEGFSDAEKHQLATFLRRELLTVDGVADVEVKGLPDEAIFIEPDIAQTVNQGVPPTSIISALLMPTRWSMQALFAARTGFAPLSRLLTVQIQSSPLPR